MSVHDEIEPRDDPSWLQEMGPFEPPEDYQFEPELRGPPPRRIPLELEQSRAVRRRRNRMVAGLLSGLLCIGLGRLPAVQFAGQFFVPLAWLSWIGLGVVVLTIFAHLRSHWRNGPLDYIQNGQPLVARICSLVMRPTRYQYGQPLGFEFATILQLCDPVTGDVALLETTSNEFSTKDKDRVTTSYRVGDYATAVYLESDPVSTMRLYGFLGLRPELGVVHRDGVSPDSPFTVALRVLGIFGLAGVFLWDVYAMCLYSPLRCPVERWLWPMLIGGAALGGPLVVLSYFSYVRRRRMHQEARDHAIGDGRPLLFEENPGKTLDGFDVGAGLVVGFLVIVWAGWTTLCAMFAANALFDSSPRRPQAVVITRMTTTTTNLLFRDHKIEYRFPRGHTTHVLYSTPQHMRRFANKLGVAQVRDGWLGWEWVETIDPIAVAPPPARKR